MHHKILGFSAKRMTCYLLLVSVGFVPLQLWTPCRASGDVSAAGMFVAAVGGVLAGIRYCREKPKPSQNVTTVLALAIFCFLLNMVSVH